MVDRNEPGAPEISEPTHPTERRGRWQASVSGLIVLVLVAGVVAAVTRDAREVWGEQIVPRGMYATPTPDPVPIARTAGLVLEVAAVFLILILARSIFGVVRSLATDRAIHENDVAWAFLWRALAIGFLLWFITEESRLLRVDFRDGSIYTSRIRESAEAYLVRQNLVPVCALIAMIGLMLGTGAGSFLAETRPPRRRPVSLLVVLAGLAGVLIMGTSRFYTLIPYYIITVLELVNLVMHHHLVPGPGLSARLVTAGIHAGVSWIACVGLAVVLARDFDRARGNEPWATTRTGWFLRLSLLASAAALGLHVAMVTIPMIHATLAEGFQQVVGRTAIFMTLCGFGLLAAGMAARALSPGPAEENPLWLRRVSAGIRWTMLGLGMLFVLFNVSSTATDDSITPGDTGVVAVAMATIRWMWNLLQVKFIDGLVIAIDPSSVIWVAVGMVMILLLFELAIRPATAVVAPFDRLGGEPALARRFIWLVSALLVVCLAALPTLFVASQTLFHVCVVGGAAWLNR